MSVFTPVSQSELEDFLANYACGTLENFQGISAGIENTNYFVTTSQGDYVLTIFELLTPSELPYFLDLMAHCAEQGIPSAHPLADRNQLYLRSLQGKPAALVQRLQGKSIEQAEPKHCQAVGGSLAQLHLAGCSFKPQRPNDRGPDWWRQMQLKLADKLSVQDRQLLADELSVQVRSRHSPLPRGVIHADLFRDNVLFVGDELTGMIDFYYACNDVWLYDLAVTVNDWCSADNNGGLDPLRLSALLSAYHEVRALNSDEEQAWPLMLRAAALRFWLSRLHDFHFQREGEITHTKDPDEFRRILLDRREQQDSYLSLWSSVI